MILIVIYERLSHGSWPRLDEGIEQSGINYSQSLEPKDYIEAEIALLRAMVRNGMQKLAELNASEAADPTELRLIQRLSHHAAPSTLLKNLPIK